MWFDESGKMPFTVEINRMKPKNKVIKKRYSLERRRKTVETVFPGSLLAYS